MPHTIGRKCRRRARSLICALAVLFGNGVFAHDSWLNGDQVDPITRGACCGVDDTKLVDDLVKVDVDGSIWFVDLPGVRIPAERIQPSGDAHWWRSMTSDEAGMTIRCVSGPYNY
jgi:hypothetical protein